MDALMPLLERAASLRSYAYSRGFPHSHESRLLCQLCAGTMSGNAEEYPEQFRGHDNVMKTICYVGNAILQALKRT
jgi:hypothetical protein